MKKGFSDLKMAKNKEMKRARGSSSTAKEDVSDDMILEKLSKIHEDIKRLKEELKGEGSQIRIKRSNKVVERRMGRSAIT